MVTLCRPMMMKTCSHAMPRNAVKQCLEYVDFGAAPCIRQSYIYMS